MTNFYRLVALQDDDPTTIDMISHEDFDFTLGTRFKGKVPQPVEFEVDPEVGGPRIPTLFLPEPVFRVEFLALLRRAGVANFDEYEARIVDFNGTECSFSGDYRAVNIVGLLDCADLARSEYEESEGTLFFDQLAIDAGRAQGVELFRVAQAEEYIVIAQSLAQRLDLSRFPDVVLRPIPS